MAKIKEAFSGLGEVSGTVLKAVGTGIATITASGVAGATALGKASLESYAEYEQLVGGVETLFKESSGVVEIGKHVKDSLICGIEMTLIQ